MLVDILPTIILYNGSDVKITTTTQEFARIASKKGFKVYYRRLAFLLSHILKTPIESNDLQSHPLKMNTVGDIIVVQYEGPPIPIDCIELPTGGKLRFIRVQWEPGICC